MKRLFLLPLLLLAMAPPIGRPYCADWQQAFESDQRALVLVPVVAQRTELTRVEVWVHGPVGQPQSANGWERGAENLPAGFFVLWTAHGFSPGLHAVTMEVLEDGMLADGWQRNPACMTLVDVR